MDWNYQIDIYIEYSTDKLELMHRSCHNAMLKNKKTMQARGNNVELCPKFDVQWS